MAPLNRQLPPLGPLVAFEAVARHLSITRAADEMALTQAAVSRKIAALEDDLGVRLFDEEVFPVCSPGYLAAHPEMTDVAALAEQTLLHLDVDYHAWTDWATWFRDLGTRPPPRRRGLQFNTYTILIQAATAGQGVALGWRHMVDDFLDQGSLVRPIADSYRPRAAYYLVKPTGREPGPDVQAFTDWLRAQARG